MSRLISLGLFKYLGISAIGVLIWYTGPYISFLKPVTHRLIAIAIVLVAFGVYVLIKKLLSRRKAEKLSEDLAANAESVVDTSGQRSDEEIATLKDKFDEALDVLRKSGKGSKHAGSLYALPWYMIIGPPGAGKTTLLVNSGLKFPLAEKMGLSKLQGVGGTRFCDWWFTDEAVIVDTAGRYTTQDSDEQVDNAAWMGFLKLLRKNRKRRPISGIIIAISMDELARQSEVDRERTAASVTQRIQELYEQLGVRFPVYVMFTKCDLMSGFMEFFGDLDRHQREQVWGTTFPVSADPLGLLDEELQLLQQQLEGRLVQRLQQERDPQRRNLIYNFTSLFNAARPLVDEFISRVFKPSRYTMTPLLRGVYFTSGTQEGTPFNRMISQLARSFSLSNATAYAGPSSGKAFFIRDLLSKVIFGESGLAGVNLKAERIYGILRTTGFVALMVLPLVLIGLWWVSSSKNQAGMNLLENEARNLNDQIQQASPQNPSLMSVLPLLNETRALTFGYGALSEPVPMSMKSGLYQGRKLARNLTVPAYKNMLENAFLSRLMIRIEQELKNSMNSPESAYQALKAYLMLGFDERLDPDYVRRWVTSDWAKLLENGLSREKLNQLTAHLDALLEQRPFTTPFPLDANLVATIRGVLEQTSHAERAYAQIKTELLSEGEEFSLASAGGPDARQALVRLSGAAFSSGVPELFTRDGYYNLFLLTQARVIQEQEDEFWIFGTEASESGQMDKAELSRRVSNLYFQDFIDTWWRFLGDIRVRSFSNPVEAAEILRLITGDDSPLVLVLRGAAEKTTLEPDIPEGGEALVSQTIGDPSIVDREFKPLRDFVFGRGDQPAPLNGIKEDITELAFIIGTLARGGTGAETEGVQKDINKAVERIRFSAENAPQPMGEWISEVADQSNNLVAGRTMSALNARWRSEVVPFCQKAIANRYPFSTASENEVALSDFGQFFGPGGIMDRFFNTNLARHVDTASNPWRIHGGASSVIRVSNAALQQMRMARDIQNAFFAQGGNLPATSFKMTPVRMDGKTTHFTLNIHGQSISYSHDAPATETLKWPGSSTFGQVQIQFSPPTAVGGSRTERGDWAWFRLLDQSNPQPGNSPEQFRLTFSLDDRWINYDLEASSAYNPFNLPQLHSFRCVPNL
jgi:type VI secretion system protein ImpL